MATTALTTLDQIKNRTSDLGVTYRMDDVPPDTLDGDAIDEASQEIYEHCLERYDEAELAQSEIVKRWAATLGTYHLAKRRLNTPPQVIDKAREEVLAKLKLVEAGSKNIADAAQKKAGVPVLSNVRVQLGPLFPRSVVVRSRSTGEPQGYVQRVAYNDYYDFNP